MKKRLLALSAVGIVLLFAYGCASTSSVSALEERVGKLEQAQKAGTPSLEADVKKADDAAVRAEAAAQKAEDAAGKAEAAEKKAETAAQKAGKEFELMQKK